MLEALKAPDAFVATVEAGALSKLEFASVLNALRRKGTANVPLLIVFSDPASEAGAVARWSGGLVRDCKAPNCQLRTIGNSRFGQSDIAHQLAGVQIPLRGRLSCGLELRDSVSARMLLEASSQQERFPALVDISVNGQPIYFLAGMAPASGPVANGGNGLIETFAKVAPVMMFLRHTAGERAWHAPSHYANLTIDDPWLAFDPYGNLEYQALSREMTHHNFHTTVAFIPWNYSRPEVASLFRNNPGQFSYRDTRQQPRSPRALGDYGECARSMTRHSTFSRPWLACNSSAGAPAFRSIR